MGQRPLPPRASSRCQRQQERPLPQGSRRRGGLGASGAGLPALLVPLWLCAAGGCSAQLYNLSLAVDEGLPADTLVGDIRAGLPPGDGQPGGFFLSEGSGESAVLADFHVQPDTGLIHTARRLDRERRARYSFVAATLRGEMVQVEIAVTDVNDHPPRFPRDSLRLNVSELSPPGTAFRLPGARDPDAGSFGTQSYTLLADGQEAAAPLFRLRYGSPPEPLDLVLLRRLDRERADSHRLLIEAWDGGSPRLSGRLRVEIRVLDENDNAPAFSQREYRARVREDAAPGTAVCRLLATDPDLGANGEVRYLINRRQSDPAAYFAVEERTGLLRVNRPLDREARALHRVIVQARDGGAEPEVGSALVSVAVLDVNDNSPAIRVLYLTEGGGARLSEAARPGDYVARVSVSDRDEAGDELGLRLQGGDGTFALRPGGTAGLYFLCVEGPLDRESRDLYELRLAATDGGSPPLSAHETLLLRIADINDQPPAFPQPRYSAAVSEAASPGTAVMRLSASDADEPGSPNAQVRYALEAAPGLELFHIDPLSGVISTRRSLDRERESALELRVVARDLGEPPLSASCLVSVRVEDANDNEPVFEQQVYSASLAEHAGPGHCLLQVTATDADAGQFGRIEYFLYDGFHNYEKSKAFQIDPHTGHICVCQDIDREGDPATYDLLVKATDGGGLSSQAFVRIEIEDINDNQPIFEPASYVTSISSHTHPGTEIINVVATDRDSGIYGVVTYELVPGEFSFLFTVDTSSGIIYLISTLSHLDHTMMFLTVSARDGGGLTSVVNASVTVNILQATLAPAVFERSRYTFSVPEDVPEGSPVGTVKAREPLNTFEVISYTISSGDPYRRFSIDPQFGIILTKKQLDHETQSLIILTVQSQLGSSPIYSSTQVNISVIDVNDNPPVFLTKSDKITISYSTVPGTALYIAHAEDKDSGLNGVIKYTIANRQSNAFTIDPSLGVVYLTKTLFTDKQHEYTLHITAEDHGTPPLSSLLMLTVIVEEQKMGTTLTFENLVYQVEVSETSSLDAKILQVQAHTQVPQHTGSQMVYSLEPSTDSAAFGIDPVTGWIYLRKYLNYESTQMYNFRAFVSSPEDSSGQNASTSVIVNVRDENDNSPIFMRDLYFFEIEESPVPRGVVGTITAVDRDSGRNGQLSYFLLSDGKFFKINSNTGEIINWVALDHEQQTHHQLIVLVTDHGDPRHNATITAYILVADINDNQPYFPQIPSGKEVTLKVCRACFSDFLIWSIIVVQDLLPSKAHFGHFQIDANNGELRTTEALSYNWRPNYRILVTASDQGMPPLQGHAVVNIQVIPFSKGRSVFSQDIRHFVIPENFKPAQILSSVKLPGHYLQTNRKLHFSISEEEDDDHFEIDSSTGDLFLSKELDYETTSHFLLRVVMKDYNKNPPQNYTVFLSIDVEDQNDHSPYFQDNFIVIGIQENVPIGTLVYTFNAKDGDGSFLNSRVQYSLEMSDSGENPFLIHPSYGTLITAIPLDREITHSVVLTVSASDQAINLTERRLGSLTAKIVILDINDNSPQFVSSSLSYVMENAEVGSLVHHVIAEDPDEARNGQVTYHILSGNENKAFMLDKTTGLLTTAFPLDHESQEYYTLTIMALDDGTPSLSATQMLTVSILDVNDERPVFQKQLYEAAVCENQNPGEFVINVEAADRDSGNFNHFNHYFHTGNNVNDQILVPNVCAYVSHLVLLVVGFDFEFQNLDHVITINIMVLATGFFKLELFVIVLFLLYFKGGNIGEYFTLNDTSGELLATRSLDREDASNFTLIIECHDLGSPPRSSTTQLQVTVLDENDNSPIFAKKTYQTSVREDVEEGSLVLELFASDEDGGLNGEVIYSLIDDTLGAFTVNSTTGAIVTTKALDRETKSQYAFRAVASDCSIQGPRSTTVSIMVHIDDANDNSPVFLQNPFQVYVPPETSVNQTIATVRAADLDLGPNGAVVFNFAVPGTMFCIDINTGEIYLQEPLPSDGFSSCLLVLASDQGVPARTATAVLAISTREQEEVMSFSHSLYAVTVPENSEAGTSLLTVEAYDHNLLEKGIKYKIFSDSEDIFSVHSITGELTVNKPKFLDHEVKSKVHLAVLAENGLNSAYCGVTVWIQDVNDNAPKFEQSSYKTLVWEGRIYNTYVMQIFATDLDSGLNGEIEYSIVSGNENETFLIDSKQGILATNAILNHEDISSYRLVVQAADRGTPSLSATSIVTVQVVDVNDNTPTIQPLGKVEISENAPPGFIVTQVSANDMDLSPALRYSFTQDGNPGMKFAINQHTGVITLVKPLDFEEIAQYRLWISVSDSVHQTEAELTIHVLDINDNPPVFTQYSYQVTVPELTPVGTSVLTVSAVDRDSEHNGIISYKILSFYEGFSIDHKNGSVFTAKPVPHLGKSSVIQLLIEAKDNGDPALTAVTSVEIQIQDVNNYAPQFTTALYNVSVSEDASVGRTILTFSAIDYDWIHKNTYIEYSIISSNTNNLFHVETSVIESTPPYKLVGNLVLSSPLDRETASSHHVIILASDRGTPPLNSSATVLITVLDVNDNPPVFSNLEYRIHVRENIPIGSHITMVSANDCDAGANAEITYTIISGNDKGHFQLDGKTGSVDLIRTLDYEETIKFTLTIQASDGGVNVRNVAFSVVFVSILDDNDYAPLFLFPSLNCVIHENLPAFSFVCTVYALDFDTGPYGHLTYSIQSSCLSDHGFPQDHDMFFIDPLTGEMQTKQILDYESQNKYCFIAQAKDKGDSIATLTVQVDVEGTDEFDPVFTEDQYFFDLPEKNEAGQLVGKVAASDNDAGLDGVIHYSLLKPSQFFSVNQSNGNICLTRTLHRKKSSTKRKDDTLELLVRAHSPKLDSKSTTCTVLVNISNSPENYSIASANILSISLTVSFVVFLLLAISLIALILRYKRKDIINSCMKRETSFSSADLSLTNEDNIPKDCQKLQSTESSTLPMGSIAEWLSLVGIREKEDIGNPSRHSDSSGHGSAEGDTAEDEEIKRINEHPCRKGLGSALSGRGSCVPDSGIPRDSDQLSCQSGETDVLADTQNAESLHIFKDGGGEGYDPNCAHNKMLSQTLQKIGKKERHIITDITREYIFISDGQDSRYGSLATLVASDEDLRGSYSWDYLLTWEPRFQPLASVFNDIAKLKDESLQIHSFPKEKKSFIFPPPLITSVAQPGIRTVPPHMPTIIPGQAFKKYPRSPLIHNLRYTSPAMTPSFSPSLSLLTLQTPTASPVMSDAGLTGTYQIGQNHATEEDVQV
uniref:Cadherin domain-containing protein n=1 Tax=Chelonoidis abingdonii TaxID=106734 RepID=A0A8C0G160_CHEAB